MRKWFVQNGLNGFLNYEVIELLLKLSDNRRYQKNTAKLLRGVLSASDSDLLKIEGIGPSDIKDVIQYLTYNLRDKSREAF